MLCPECQNEIDDGSSVCPVCGFDVNTSKWECAECHSVVDSNVDTCPMCGSPKKVVIQSETVNIAKQQGILKKGKVGMALIVVACILFIVGVTRITNSMYNFYKEHYAECEKGYIETKSEANLYSSGILKSSYNTIASSYERLMDDDMKKINSFRIQAGACWAAGTGLLVAGIKKKKG